MARIGPAGSTRRRAKRGSLWLLAIAVTVGAMVTITVLLGPVSWLLAGRTVRAIPAPDQRATALNAVRQTVLLAAGGASTGLGLVVTFRTYLAGRRGQLADRYAACVRLLASDRMDERLGGIFAIEQLLNESDTARPAAVQILVAFLRRRADRSGDERHSPAALPTGPPSDVQTVLSVLGRRPSYAGAAELDLSDLDLRRARLSGARLAGVRLSRSLLDQADISSAVLVGADLADCGLTGVNLARTDLSHANLSGADATGSDFSDADLRCCVLRGTQLRHAKLSGALVAGADPPVSGRTTGTAPGG